MIQPVTKTLARGHEKNPARLVAILGIGTATPPTISQEDAEALAVRLSYRTREQELWAHRIYTHSGVKCKGSVLMGDGDPFFYQPPQNEHDRGPTTAARMARYAIESPKLGMAAARAALVHADVAPADITHLISVSCTGFFAPGLDIALQTDLGLSPTVHRTHIGFMGCHGAFNALAVARSIAAADPDAVVLICCVELCSLHYAYGWNPEKLVANALFADGAAAAVVSATSHDHGGWRLAATASRVLPQAHDAMTWNIGDHGFDMTLSMQVPKLIAENLRPWCTEWLADHRLTLSDIASWAVHPGGPKILATVEESLNLPPAALAASREILCDHGNMSSATILFILNRLAATGHNGPCVAIGFGPGLAMEGMLLEK